MQTTNLRSYRIPEGLTVSYKDDTAKLPLRLVQVPGGYVTVREGQKLDEVANITPLNILGKVIGIGGSAVGILSSLLSAGHAPIPVQFAFLLVGALCFLWGSLIAPRWISRRLHKKNVLVVPGKLFGVAAREMRLMKVDFPLDVFVRDEAATRQLIAAYRKERLSQRVRRQLTELVRRAGETS